MKSPKFRLRKQDLESVITTSNIKTTWKGTVRDAMKRQFIEDPVEFLDINLSISSVASNLTTLVVDGEYVPHVPTRILSEKSKGLCRQIVVPHPYDCLVLQCLSNNLYPFLKKNAPHNSAYYQPDRGFNSKIANKTGYSGLQAWLNFQKAILEFSKTRPIVVVSDIANYYDTINYHSLRNVLANYIPDQKESVLDLTLHILGYMLWQPDYMPRIEVGLPQVDLDAPRLLAHTFLYELDRFLATTKNIDYARFMDDIDIGVDSIEQAKVILRDIDLTLHSRHVRLNAGKTRILVGDEIPAHFKIRENLLLKVLTEWAEANPTEIARTRRLLGYLLRRWERTGTFDFGNGEKILKRLLNYAADYGLEIGKSTIQRFLRMRPSVREEVFRYVSRIGGGEKYLGDLTDYIGSGLVVDDASALLFAYAVVEMRIPKKAKARKILAKTALELCKNSRAGAWIYAGLWILSKFGTERQIWDAICATYRVWQPDYRLGRVVGGLESVLVKQNENLRELIRSSRNLGAAEVIEFFDAIRLDPKKANAIWSYIAAINPSYPLRITHAKWIVVLSVLRSSVVPLTQRQKLRNIHWSALSDHHYAVKVRAVTALT